MEEDEAPVVEEGSPTSELSATRDYIEKKCTAVRISTYVVIVIII
jgi:hypothetical protein